MRVALRLRRQRRGAGGGRRRAAQLAAVARRAGRRRRRRCGRWRRCRSTPTSRSRLDRAGAGDQRGGAVPGRPAGRGGQRGGAAVADRACHRIAIRPRPAWSTPAPSSRCRVSRHRRLHAMGIRVATGFSARLFNLLITNVPGAQSQMYVAGTKLLETYAVPPLLTQPGAGHRRDVVQRHVVFRHQRRPRSDERCRRAAGAAARIARRTAGSRAVESLPRSTIRR